MQPVPLFVELCAGTAAVSLRLQDGERKPPISRTGGKAGFADATLRVLGLAPGQQALRYVWAEPDASARLLLATLPGGSQRAAWAKCVEARWTLETFHFENFWLGPVNVTWQLPWPVWWAYADLLPLGDHLGTFADTASYTFGQSVVSQTINATPQTFTITNSGNARVMDGLIEFDGVITNPTVKNLTNKYQFTWTGSLAAADRLTLKIAAFDVKKNGVRGQWANITMGTARGQLLPMVLEPGANLFEITSTAPNCVFRYYFADSWM